MNTFENFEATWDLAQKQGWYTEEMNRNIYIIAPINHESQYWARIYYKYKLGDNCYHIPHFYFQYF